MDIILLEKIRNLGELGEQVSVKAGYARNFLLPLGKAVVANDANKAEFEARRAELEKAQAEVLDAARARAGKIDGMRIELAARASEDGKLFGSIGPREVADAISATGVEVNRSEVLMPEGPIKEVSEIQLEVALHAEVTAKITVSVTPEA